MQHDPLRFCLDDLPARFAQTKLALEAAAASGDKRAITRLADVEAAYVCSRLEFAGGSDPAGGEVFLIADHGETRVTAERPSEPAVRFAVSVPLLAAERALTWALGRLGAPGERAAEGPGLPSNKADQVFSKYKFAFDVQLLAVPELGDVSVRFAFGRDLPPAAEFTLKSRFADLVAARAKGLGPQELLASGKLTVGGDVAKAMMFAMTLTQLR